MTRRNIATILCLAAATSLVLVAGCKKAKKSDGDKSGGAMTSPMKGTTTPAAPTKDPMTAMGAQTGTTTRPAPVKALGKGRVGALPIPGDYPLITVFAKALRQAALFKKYEAKLKGMMAGVMAKQKMFQALVTKCKLDLFGNVDAATLSRSPTASDPENTVIIVSGSFDAPKLLACMSGAMKAAKIQHKDVTIGGKKGYTIQFKTGKSATVLALSPKSFGMIGSSMLPQATAVLEGKVQSIEDTEMYKEGMKALAGKPATVLAVLVPTVPAAMLGKIKFPVARKIRAAKAMIGLPGGGLDLQAAVDLGDAKTAKMAAKTVPALLGIVRAKLGALGVKLLQNLKVVDDATWVKVDLKLDQATFGQLQEFVTKMLGSMMGGGDAAPAGKAPAPAMAPKKAKKAKKAKK